MATALSQEGSKNKIPTLRIQSPQQGEKKKMIDFASRNAGEALRRHLAAKETTDRILVRLQTIFHLEKIPERIEIYDNSHLQGSSPVGVMVVANREGFVKKAYRRFTIKADGCMRTDDDYAMMRQVFERRFGKITEENRADLPDLILVDGGKGQLSVAHQVLISLDLDLPIVGIAKGPERNAGRENFYLPSQNTPFQLDPQDPVLYYCQRLRDEAHRFAIMSHRKKRAKSLRSGLEDIPGVGKARKKQLLHHFGSLKGVRDASRDELESVEGVSAALAGRIYDTFHEET